MADILGWECRGTNPELLAFSIFWRTMGYPGLHFGQAA